ncbi:hypothetical protein VTO73DRAFT_14019 [Trametes versicolor]
MHPEVSAKLIRVGESVYLTMSSFSIATDAGPATGRTTPDCFVNFSAYYLASMRLKRPHLESLRLNALEHPRLQPPA